MSRRVPEPWMFGVEISVNDGPPIVGQVMRFTPSGPSADEAADVARQARDPRNQARLIG